MMTNTILILLIVAFMLGEAALMPKKIQMAFPSPEKKNVANDQFTHGYQ